MDQTKRTMWTPLSLLGRGKKANERWVERHTQRKRERVGQ